MLRVYFDDELIDVEAYTELDNEYKLFTDTFKLGSVASNTFKLSVLKTAVNSQPTNVRIEDDNTTWNFIVDNIDGDDNFYAYTLTDKLVDFNFDYDASVLINSKAELEEDCYLSDIWKDMCLQANVEYDETYVFENDIVVTWYDSRIKARKYLSFIAELQSGYACILENGKQSFKKQNRPSTKTIDGDVCSDLIVGEKKKITRVVYDGGTFKWEFGDETGDTLYLQSDNVYITSEQIVENIYNNIKDFEFYIIDVPNAPMDSSVRAGDIITFDDNDKLYPTIAQYSMSYAGGWIGGYKLSVNTKKQEETQVTRTANNVRNLQTKVDRLNNEFSIIAEEIEKLTDYIRNVGTTGNYIKLPNTPKSNGAINKLSIKGFELMPLYPGMAYPSEYTYSGVLSFYTLIFDTVLTFDNEPNYVFINSSIPLQKLGTVYDELIIEANKAKVIQRIGYDFINEQWSVLSTPITHELNDVLLPTFDGDTFVSVKYFDNLIYDAEYLIKNDLTSNFATQLESSSVLSITQDAINTKVSKDGVISEINQSAEQIAISANKLSLEGYTTINDGFSVDLDGNATMNNATIKGDIYIPNTESKVIGNLGIFGGLHISQKGLIGQEFASISGGYAFIQNVIKFVFYIPDTFTVSKAYIILKQTKTKHIPVMADSVDGQLTTVNLYSGTTERTYIVSDYWDAEAAAFEDNDDTGTVITSAFNNYTAPNIYSNTVLSADISSSITTGINNLFINNGSVTELFEASNHPDPTSLINARLPKSCYAYADLIIYGYDKT